MPDSNALASEAPLVFDREWKIRPEDESIRSEGIMAAFKQMRADFEEDHFASALGHFREALCLSQGLPALKASVRSQTTALASALLPRNWRVAETLLLEAATFDPGFSADPGLLTELRAARVEELVIGVIHQVDKAEFTGSTDQARRKLVELIALYPEEKRLSDRLVALDTPRQVVKKAGSGVSKTGGKSAFERFDFAAAATAPTEGSEPGELRNTLKNFAAMAATTAMLGSAGFLIWHHFSAPVPHPQQVVRVPTPPSIAAPPSISRETPVVPAEKPVPPPDERAWNLVKTSDNAPSLRAFLAAFPDSAHVLRVKVRLAAMEWAQVDKTNTEALEVYLRAHPRGFYKSQAERLVLELNARKIAEREVPPVLADREAILQAVHVYRVGGGKATLQEPVIEGDRATVSCLPDGGSTDPVLTYSLQKADGIWRVQSIR